MRFSPPRGPLTDARAEALTDRIRKREGNMRLLRRRLSSLREDDGVTIIEVVVASALMLVAVLGVIGSMGAGMGLVGHSRQRSSGTGIAQEKLERARNTPYDNLSVFPQVDFNPDAGHPDHAVIEGDPATESDDQYQLPDSACPTPPCAAEPLIIGSAAGGGISHIEDPYELANTEFIVHQYVTWVADVVDTEPDIPGVQSYKRVAVVVTWKFPVYSGPRHTVVESTFVSDGTVAIPSASPGATASPTPAPTAPPGGGGTLGPEGPLGFPTGLPPAPAGATGSCTGGAPVIDSVDLLAGSGGYVLSPSIDLRFTAHDPNCTLLWLFMTNKPASSDCLDPSGYAEVQDFELDATGAPLPLNVSWPVSSADGPKTICAVVQDDAGHVSQAWAVNVVLDGTPPTVPGDFTATSCTKPGNDRTVFFGWQPSTDTNLVGYRLYRSIESGAWELRAQTDQLTISDTSLKSYSSVQYKVLAHDKAGNQSLDPPILSYAKNQC